MFLKKIHKSVNRYPLNSEAWSGRQQYTFGQLFLFVRNTIGKGILPWCETQSFEGKPITNLRSRSEFANFWLIILLSRLQLSLGVLELTRLIEGLEVEYVLELETEPIVFREINATSIHQK